MTHHYTGPLHFSKFLEVCYDPGATTDITYVAFQNTGDRLLYKPTGSKIQDPRWRILWPRMSSYNRFLLLQSKIQDGRFNNLVWRHKTSLCYFQDGGFNYLMWRLSCFLSFSTDDPCSPDPCQNSGTCSADSNSLGFKCSCSPGYIGLNCGIQGGDTNFSIAS